MNADRLDTIFALLIGLLCLTWIIFGAAAWEAMKAAQLV